MSYEIVEVDFAKSNSKVMEKGLTHEDALEKLEKLREKRGKNHPIVHGVRLERGCA